MKYFIKCNITQREKINDAGIHYESHYLNNQRGILVTEQHIDEVAVLMKWQFTESIIHNDLTILKYKSIRTKNASYGFVGTIKKHYVGISNWSGSNNNRLTIMSYFEKMSDIIKKSINISVPHGSVREINKDKDQFKVFIWSSCTQERSSKKYDKNDYRMPSRIFGIRVDCKDNPFMGGGKGISIVDPESGYCVAELFENCLYIHHDVVHYGTEDELKIINYIIERSIELLIKDHICVFFEKRLEERSDIIEKVICDNLLPIINKKFIGVRDNYNKIYDGKIVPETTSVINIGYTYNKKILSDDKNIVIGGIKLPDNSLLNPSGQGIPIYDNEIIIAEIFNKNINILIRDWGSKDVLIHIVDKIADFFRMEEKEKETLKINSNLIHQNILSGLFAKNMIKKRNTIIRNIRKDYPKLQEKVTKYQKLLSTSILELDCLVNIDKGLTDDDFKKKATEQYKMILRNKNVIDLVIDTDYIVVETSNLFCKHDDKIYDIGAFKITINTYGPRQGEVVFKNLTREIKAYNDEICQAPHVFERGNACLGNISSILPQLISKGEYASVVTVCVEFLQSVNANDSAGRHIIRWPTVSEEIYNISLKNRKQKNISEIPSYLPF